MERTQEEKILAGLSHIAVLIQWLYVGVIFNAVIFFIYRSKSRYVSDHAKQGLALSIVYLILGFVIATIFGVGAGIGIGMGSVGGLFGGLLLGGLLSLALFIAMVVLVVRAAVKGFNGQEYRYPYIGDFVAKLGE